MLVECNQYLTARLNESSLKNEPAWVLEAGGGSATHFAVPNNAKVLALDIEYGQLAKNKQTPFKIQGDLHHLPVSKEKMDMVICFNVIEHLNDPESVLKQLAETLKPGGMLVLGCPTRNSLKGFITRMTPIGFHRWFYKVVVGKKDRGDGHYDAFPTPFRRIVAPTPLRNWLKAEGFEVLFFRTYDGAKAYKISTGSALRRCVSAPYYAIATLGRWLTFKRWQAQESDLLLIAKKALP